MMMPTLQTRMPPIQNNMPSARVKFGNAEAAPAPAAEDAKSEAKPQEKSVKPSFIQKYTSFFSPSNLMAGFAAAKDSLKNAGKLEALMLVADAVFFTASMGMHLLLAPVMPDWMVFSNTLKSFIKGVQNASVQKQMPATPAEDKPVTA